MTLPDPAHLILPEIVPVFPLPGIVLFPLTVLPLHIFEPRYRRMTAQALQADRIIVMALPVPGPAVPDASPAGAGPNAAQPDPAATRGPGAPHDPRAAQPDDPAIFPVACAGRIVDSTHHPDGRYNIILTGLIRVDIDQEIPGEEFRRARIRVRHEKRDWLYSDEAGPEIIRLLSLFKRLRAGVEIIASGVDLAGDAGAREITLNTMAMHLNVPAIARQRLLEQDDVGERARLVAEILARSDEERHVLDRFRDEAPDDPRVN